jgi:hypothetical protein
VYAHARTRASASTTKSTATAAADTAATTTATTNANANADTTSANPTPTAGESVLAVASTAPPELRRARSRVVLRRLRWRRRLVEGSRARRRDDALVVHILRLLPLAALARQPLAQGGCHLINTARNRCRLEVARIRAKRRKIEYRLHVWQLLRQMGHLLIATSWLGDGQVAQCLLDQLGAHE